MSDPRNTIGYDEIKSWDETRIIDGVTITYDVTKKGGSAQAQAMQTGQGMLAVKLSGDGTVALADDGDAIEGGLIHVEADGKCLVRVGGNIPFLKGTGATLTRDFKVVGDTGGSGGTQKGYVREAASGTAAELNKGRGQILDTSDTNKVYVRF
ncbi:MAG: hypothetical protein JOZ52_08400 [Acidobacteria bacterium]|nr:hypothetical protein [Acidobacteriota bacterium]